MSAPQSRNIAYIGGRGNIGGPTLDKLIAQKVHTITIIQRPESNATYGPEVTVKKGAWDDEAFLVEALRGNDVVLTQLPIPALTQESGFIRAAAKAGVSWYLPTEFGSDPDAKLVDSLPLLKHKAANRKLIQDLGMSSIAVITNPWFEFCLPYGIFGLDVKGKKATLWNNGNNKITTSTMDRVSSATAQLLSLPEADFAAYKNKAFYVSSFSVTQREMLDIIFRETGTKEEDWTIVQGDPDAVEKQWGEKVLQGDHGEGFQSMFPMLHFREGYGGDYEHKVDLAKFDLEKEDLESVIKRTLKTMDV
jgi:hypothetical protein